MDAGSRKLFRLAPVSSAVLAIPETSVFWSLKFKLSLYSCYSYVRSDCHSMVSYVHWGTVGERNSVAGLLCKGMRGDAGKSVQFDPGVCASTWSTTRTRSSIGHHLQRAVSMLKE